VKQSLYYYTQGACCGYKTDGEPNHGATNTIGFDCVQIPGAFNKGSTGMLTKSNYCGRGPFVTTVCCEGETKIPLIPIFPPL